MSDNKVLIEAELEIDTDGTIAARVYVGEYTTNPVTTERKKLTSLIDNLLEAFTSPLNDKISSHHYQECDDLVRELEEATKYAKKRIKKMK